MAVDHLRACAAWTRAVREFDGERDAARLAVLIGPVTVGGDGDRESGESEGGVSRT
jgi:hypothetical protein